MPVNNLIQLRKGSAAIWESTNPVLASGEPGYDTTNNLLKIGDGTLNWTALSGVNIGNASFNSSVNALIPTIANSGDNRILTSTGTTTGINAESSLTFDGISLAVPSGSAASPGIVAIGDPNTGLYFAGADSLSLSTGGTQRLNINSSGFIGIGTGGTAGRTLILSRQITGNIGSIGILQQGTVQSDVTSNAIGCYNIMNIASTAFTLPAYSHFVAAANAPVGGAAVTTQIGFSVSSAMTGATNNWGFRGALAAAASNWNTYNDGTAQNYFAGNVGIGTGKTAPAVALDIAGGIATSSGIGIGTNPTAGYSLRCARTITGATTAYAYTQEGTVQSDVTSGAVGFLNQLNTVASAFTLTSYNHFQASQATIGATSSVTTQNGFLVAPTLTGATNNIGFRGQIPSGTNRWNTYNDGTAQNWFAGNVGIGTGKSAPASELDVNGLITATSGNFTQHLTSNTIFHPFLLGGM